MAIPNPDPKTIEIDAYAAPDREWQKAQTAYDRGDLQALDLGYDKAYAAALAVAYRYGYVPAEDLANRAAAGEEDAI